MFICFKIFLINFLTLFPVPVWSISNKLHILHDSIIIEKKTTYKTDLIQIGRKHFPLCAGNEQSTKQKSDAFWEK